VLLDGAATPGAKILVSGGARCNVTNTVVSEADFWGGRRTFVRQILRGFPVSETIAFFREIGVPLHEEADGKLFPDTNRSRDVLNALLRASEQAGVGLRAGHRVTGIERVPDALNVKTSQGDLEARAVVLATGGRSLPKSGSDGAGYAMAERLGHTIVPTTPGLAPLLLSTEGPGSVHRALTGVAHDVQLTIRVDGVAATRISGRMLWTHFGVSGPAALDASRHWARAHLEGKTVTVTANFCGGATFDEIDGRLVALTRERPKASIQTTLSTLVPAAVASTLLERLSIDNDTSLAQLSRDDRRRLTHALAEWNLAVVGTRGYNYAEVTAGGVAIEEIDPSTMESRVCPRLYLVGEILNVDGRLGGFNFQWAWATGRVAARGLAAATP
jgi:predicted Rossmann fold flavoprotein